MTLNTTSLSVTRVVHYKIPDELIMQSPTEQIISVQTRPQYTLNVTSLNGCSVKHLLYRAITPASVVVGETNRSLNCSDKCQDFNGVFELQATLSINATVLRGKNCTSIVPFTPLNVFDNYSFLLLYDFTHTACDQLVKYDAFP